eukprot:CAMPEP_0183745716 /NCGR_PEP_ID=MMETSP0737-20130205/66386_1 /TAXON_ID=385413 /ORGANISM="Thalassiosira miniscula, Strain CCMP1093" /LENGTH=555 /DNA_ID=CAMNT_0025981395 /DNA_START=35 /DNA_END=1702 /DNA_ORIENTATION=+
MKFPGGFIASSLSLAELSTAFIATSKLQSSPHPQSQSKVLLDESNNNNNFEFEDGYIEKQKMVSSDTTAATVEASPSSPIQDYLKHQQECFDEMSHFFNSEEASPPEVQPLLRYLVKRALLDASDNGNVDDEEKETMTKKKKLKILDVGCGTGALFSTYLEVADELELSLDITGLDLSPKMVEFANENSKRLMVERNDGGDDGKDPGEHSVECVTGDFVQLILGVERSEETLTGFDHGVVDESTSKYRGVFDAVMINACFGNFYDSNSAITAAANCLKDNGVFIIAHPLGAEFVEKLARENPKTVPNTLPSKETLTTMLRFQPLKQLDLAHAAEIDGTTKTIYYASMQKQPRRMLRRVVRLRGPVDQGYGRGGKKLGFPTANLPSSLFADALSEVPTGVYVGSATIEPQTEEEGEGKAETKKGRGVVHKAVVNVGYSPTFDGEENKEKIVEAHLIIDEGDIEGDFYGETMRLALFGFLRPEMKFPSFPDLIKAITNDVQTAKMSLDLEPYITFSNDQFLTTENGEGKWIGKAGGDDIASYEFENSVDLLSFSKKL